MYQYLVTYSFGNDEVYNALWEVWESVLGEHLSLDARGAYLGSSNLESATAVRELLLKRMVAHLEYDGVSQITDNINALVVCKVSDVAT